MIAALLAFASLATAAPSEVAFQGRIADASGGFLNGVHSMTFELFATETGGAARWTETATLDLSDGIFSIQLGASSANPLDLDALGGSAWIETTINDELPLAPRQPLSAVPFSRLTEALITVEPECDASGTGRLYFDTSTHNVRICDGTEFLRMEACSTSCLQPGEIECGDSSLTGCGEACPGTGTGLNPSECGLASSEECNSPMADSCANDCGYAGSALAAAQCDAAATVTCGDAIADDCGNNCGYGGNQCPDGLTCDGSQCQSCSGSCCGLDIGDDQSISVAELNSCLSAAGAAFSGVQYIEIAYGHLDYLDSICQQFGYSSYAGVYGSDQCSSGANMYPSYCGQGTYGAACNNGCGNTNYPGFTCNP